MTLQYEPKVSDRPSKTGRQLQSVAKQFGSIGKTVGADADQNYADADGDTMMMLIMLLLIMLTLLLLMLMIWVLIMLIMLTLLLLMLMMCGLMLMLFSSGEQEDQEEPWEHHTTCQVLIFIISLLMIQPTIINVSGRAPSRETQGESVRVEDELLAGLLADNRSS